MKKTDITSALPLLADCFPSLYFRNTNKILSHNFIFPYHSFHISFLKKPEKILKKQMLTGNSEKGFTLIEIMLVVAILAIIAGAGIALLNDSGTDFNIDSAAGRIASDINYAKSFAISSGKTINIVFDSANEKYSIDDGSTFIKHPLRKDDFIVTFTDKFGLKNVDLYQVAINGGGSTLSFKSDGTVNGGNIEIRYSGKKINIIVDSSTGTITVQ